MKSTLKFEREKGKTMSLKPIQNKATRLCGLGVVAKKVKLASRIGVSSRTLFSWFRNEEFLQQFEKYEVSTDDSTI